MASGGFHEDNFKVKNTYKPSSEHSPKSRGGELWKGQKQAIGLVVMSGGKESDV